MEKKQVIANIMAKEGAEMVKGLTIKNVTITPQEEYVRLGITLSDTVKGYNLNQESGNYELGETKVIFSSLYSINSLLKENPLVAFASSRFLENPNSMLVILSGAKIDIIQEPVVAGEEYRNPWSETAEATVFDHDTIINHIVNIKLSDFAMAKIDRLADSLLGI